MRYMVCRMSDAMPAAANGRTTTRQMGSLSVRTYPRHTAALAAIPTKRTASLMLLATYCFMNTRDRMECCKMAPPTVVSGLGGGPSCISMALLRSMTQYT